MLSKRQLAASGYEKDTKQSISKDQTKIKLHCVNTDQQFCCFIGTELNGLYDNLIYSAKDEFKLDHKSLKIYEQYKDGNKSYIAGLGDLIEHLDDSEKQKYLHLYLEQRSTIPPNVSNINVPFVVEQSCTDISKSPDIAKSPDAAHYITVPHHNSFRTISASSIHSFHSVLTDGDFSDSSSEDMSTLLQYGCEFDETTLLSYGYKIIEIISETFDGCIYKAEMVSVPQNSCDRQINNNISLTSDTAKNHRNGLVCDKIVAIKKIDKNRSEKNIIKRAKILHYLTVQNKSLNNNICAFIDFIETEECYYLIEEFGGSMTLKEFSDIAHGYIQQKRLKIKEWKIVAKWIFWQLVIDLYWMHNCMFCSHLDLNMENIFVHNAIFVENKDNNVISIDAADLSVKMCGFGLSEVFKCSQDVIETEFKCNKSWLPQEYNFASPQVLDKSVFDAMKSDTYSLGVILFAICFGVMPYQSPNVSDEEYSAIKKKNVSQYLKSNGLSKYISKNALDVIENMLKFDESERINIEQILHHRWFRSYYARCKSRINRKGETQKLKHVLQKNDMKMFPYYNCQK